MADILAMAGLVILIVGVISVISPRPAVGISTRSRGFFVLFVGTVIFILGVNLTPERDSGQEVPSEKLPATASSDPHVPHVIAKSSSRGADCNDWGGPLFFRDADVEDVNRCLQAGEDPNALGEGGFLPLTRAAMHRNIEALKALLEAGANPNGKIEGKLPLHFAASWGNVEVVKALLNAGADVNLLAGNGTPLHDAALAEKADVVRVLLEAGADPDAKNSGGDSPLHRAAYGNVEILTELLNAGAEVNVPGALDVTPLMFAVQVPKRAIVMKLLLRAGAHPNARDARGWSPLHYASHAEAVMALLEAGALLEARDSRGQTPLHFAAAGMIQKSTEAVRPLIDAGANVNARDNEGRTPLHWAASRWMGNNPQVARALIDAGTDVNARDNEGLTPLHLAASWSKNDEFVSALLTAGADPHARDSRGNLALGRSRLIRLFRKPNTHQKHTGN